MQPSLNAWRPVSSLSLKTGVRSTRIVENVLKAVIQTFHRLNIGWTGVDEVVDSRLYFPELQIASKKQEGVFSSNLEEIGVFHVMGKTAIYNICLEACIPGFTKL